MARSVFTVQKFRVIKEPLERGASGERGVVDGVEVYVQTGHEEVAGGVISEVQGG